MLLGALPYAPLDQGVDRWVESYALKWLTRAEAELDDDADTVTVVEAEDVTQTLSERPSQTGTDTETGTGTGTETATGEMSQGQDFSHAYTDPDGRYLEALLLVEGVGRASRLSAVLVVETVSSQPVYLGHALRRRIASELLEHGDVSGWRKP
jgi:hypothetical protein